MRNRGVVTRAMAALAAGAALFSLSSQSSAAVVVVGGGAAETCSDAARTSSSISLDLQACTIALQEEQLDNRARSATYVNRGVIYMRRGDREAALADFERAIAIGPHTAEALVNRGAIRIVEQRYEEALADTERALGMELSQPERAYFNRGIAYEEMGRLREAYADYRRASELRPGWNEPRVELARFSVR